MQYDSTQGAQGICPNGWHVPTDGDWTILSDYLGGESVAGGKMKSIGTINAGTGLWYAPNEGATNESGFTGLPGGYREYSSGAFIDCGKYGSFWTSTQTSGDGAWMRGLYYYWDDLFRFDNYKTGGYSIRCLKD
jgi:uncharacterized protein (TIGR02145 family)